MFRPSVSFLKRASSNVVKKKKTTIRSVVDSSNNHHQNASLLTLAMKSFDNQQNNTNLSKRNNAMEQPQEYYQQDEFNDVEYSSSYLKMLTEKGGGGGGGDGGGTISSSGRGKPWIDRDAERKQELLKHRRTPEYVELHRQPARHSDLGLYGGEAGFETTPRVWVDPDNPHVSQLYNRTPLGINMSWARYGHFKRELHIIDVDKLCRHARLVPPVDKLLTDLVSARVALDDDQCSALIRHGARSLVHLTEGTQEQQEFYERIEQTFERFLVAVAPPMFAGPRTHADMIRVCSMVKNWEAGFDQYYQRAVEEAKDEEERAASFSSSQRQNNNAEEEDDDDDFAFLFEARRKRLRQFELSSDFYDAVIDLCVSCEKHQECLNQLRKLILTGHRPRLSSLTNALISCTALKDRKTGFEIFRLVDLYEHSSSSSSTSFSSSSLDQNYFEARAAFCAQVEPELAWSNLREAISHSNKSPAVAAASAASGEGRLAAITEAGKGSDDRSQVTLLTPKMISWTLLALSRSSSSSSSSVVEAEDALKILSLAETYGLAIDYENLTFALMVCYSCSSSSTDDGNNNHHHHHNNDNSAAAGDVAIKILREKTKLHRVNITPEMTLIALRCFSRLPSSTLSELHANVALETISAAEVTNKHSSHFAAIFYSLFQLLSRLGAMATFSSCFRKYILSRGASVSDWSLRSWLWCNSIATAPNGGHSITHEALSLLKLRTHQDEAEAPSLTQEFVSALALCRLQHGCFPEKMKKEFSQFLLYADLDEEKEETTPPAKENNKEQEGGGEEKDGGVVSLLDLVDSCCKAIEQQIEFEKSKLLSDNGDNEQQGEEHVETKKKKKKKKSLQEFLSSNISSSTEEESENTSGGGKKKKSKQQEKEGNDDYKDDEDFTMIDQSEIQLPSSFSEYDTCKLVADQLTKLLLLLEQEEDEERGIGRNQSSPLLVATLFSGLPREENSSTRVYLEEKFEPTPSSLRALRARWTISSNDIQLRRFGQKVAGVKPPYMHPAKHVQPFDGNA